MVYFNRGEHDRVIADFTKAIELQPNAPSRLLASRYLMRGLAYHKTHSPDLAIADFRVALAINPDQRSAKDWLIRPGANP